MYAILETNSDDLISKGKDSVIKIDSNIQSLSWMSKINLIQDLNKNEKLTNYYQEGWLATGNSNQMVGCTFTSCIEEHLDNENFRTNFNLRGHKSEIKLVKWNEPYQKLASCDVKGVIYIWVKYEGRWSIELINDRSHVVTDFAWSHDGKQAVICYQDGFVLVGSVNGQRYWSNLYDLSNSVITSATWAPNDSLIVLGLSNGSLMVIDENGTMLSRHKIKEDPIELISYNCPNFFINELIELNKQSNDSSQRTRLRSSVSNFNVLSVNNQAQVLQQSNQVGQQHQQQQQQSRSDSRLRNKINNNLYSLTICFKSSSFVYIVKNFDNFIDPIIIDTKMEDLKFDWSSCGKLLAVCGCDNALNMVKFYSQSGALLYKLEIPVLNSDEIINKNSIIDKLEMKQKNFLKEQNSSSQTQSESKPILNALTWGHNDKRLFLACSNQLHIIRIIKHIPSLSLLSQYKIKQLISSRSDTSSFCLPDRLKHTLSQAFNSSLKMTYPKINTLRKFVCTSNHSSERLHCTLKRLNIKNSTDYFILYLEYLGGLVPLLSAKKVSKLKPDFVIFDPFLELKSSSNLKKSKSDSSFDSFKSNESVLFTSDNKKILKNINNNISNNYNNNNNYKKFSINKKRKKSLRFNTNRFSHKVKDNSFELNRKNRNSLISNKKKENLKKKNKLSKFKNNYLVEIRSNFWGTKFKFIGHNYLPNFIGKIIYKTSLFHLQPRQMTITLEDLTYLNKLNFSKKCNEKIKSKISASSTLGLLPSTQTIRTKSLSGSYSSLMDQSIFSININNKIEMSTAQDLIETKFGSQSKLPVLKLAEYNSPQLYTSGIEDDSKEINCLITSVTSQVTTTTTTTASTQNELTPLILNKKNLKINSKKNSFLNKFNTDYIMNYLRNRKNYSIDNRYEKCLENLDENEEENEQALEDSEEESLNDDEESQQVTGDENKKINNVKKNNQFVLHNKPPIWNETNQVYQLDFGGRVTQESAKNFQVEYQGRQVMQFGRIDTNAYTLDFEWPFTTVQAFSIALANITQRLK